MKIVEGCEAIKLHGLVNHTALLMMFAAPCLLRSGPTSLPVRITRITVEGCRCRVWTAPGIVMAAPLLFAFRPACSPVAVARMAIVGERSGWRGRATTVGMFTAPLLFRI